MNKFLFLIFILLLSCNKDNLKVITTLDNKIKEASAIETIKGSGLLWTIEDSGNARFLYGLNNKGSIEKKIEISNGKNKDWEDLTTDHQGNIYIGDFGNNRKPRENFIIYKVSNPEKIADTTTAELIKFTLPKHIGNHDFEGFFLFKNNFYIFSKTAGDKGILISVPNRIGDHEATFKTNFELKGCTGITSADISLDEKTILLLNYNKLWRLTNFSENNFFDGAIESLHFNHDSQKKGICFQNNNTVYITDERYKKGGGFLYTFNVD